MSQYTLISDISAPATVPPDGIVSRTLHNDERSKAILFTFAPGQGLSPHSAPVPAYLHFLRGQATVTLGDETVNAAPGTFVHMTPNLRHGIQALTEVVMLLVMVKAAH